MRKHLRVTDEDDRPLNLTPAFGIKVLLPRPCGPPLNKIDVDIVDAARGMIAIALTDPELQSLRIGEAQDFEAEIMMSDHTLIVFFSGALTVRQVDGRKVWV